MLLESKLQKERNQNIQEYKMWIIKEMFKFIGAEYTDNLVSEEDWFLVNTWSQDEENKFKNWFVDDLRSLGLTKKLATEEANFFLMNYGWKTKC